MNIGTARFTLCIPEQHPCFEGHFPGDPLVPGALLLQWLAQHIEQQLPGLSPTTLKVMKFIAPVRPGYRCEVELTRQEQKVIVAGSWQGNPCFHGQFLLEPRS